MAYAVGRYYQDGSHEACGFGSGSAGGRPSLVTSCLADGAMITAAFVAESVHVSLCTSRLYYCWLLLFTVVYCCLLLFVVCCCLLLLVLLLFIVVCCCLLLFVVCCLLSIVVYYC